MSASIERAAVIGSGVMGSAIAAHIANAGIPVLLLDIVPAAGAKFAGDPASRDVRDALARTGLARALKSRPAAFFVPERARLVTTGNIEDDLPLLADVDWVVEVVVENLDIKKKLFERIVPHLKGTAVLSTNTSGLSVTDMAAALPASFRPRFLGTHFFNPPRYLRLLELIPHPGTDPATLEHMRVFGEEILGKGAVVARDTPNFIANRVGGFTVMSVMRAMVEGKYTAEEVDALTGPVIGRAKSATLRTADLVGLDILAHASKTVYDRAVEDPWRDYFAPPPFVARMIEKGLLGGKTGGGFYRKNKSGEVETLDIETLEYRPRAGAKFASLEMARATDDMGPRIRALMAGKDRAAVFTWRTLSEALVYPAALVDELADDIVAIDCAMRWGFGWELGPFELWDAIGVEWIAGRLRAEKREVPAVVEAVLRTPEKSFYTRSEKGSTHFFRKGGRARLEDSPARVDLRSIKENGGLVKKNAGASLVDIGDGILCLEFHSKMNAIGADIVAMIMAGVKEAETNFAALVIGNHEKNFSVGANLMLLLLEAQEGNWDEVDLMVRQFQKATMVLKYCRRPVVAAPFGMALGGGCEVVLGAGHVYAAAETYMGLVEVGVGLIPAGGGCKELLMRNLEGRPDVEDLDLFPFVRAAFETIALAKVSTSGVEARRMKMLRASDGIAMNPDRLLYSAKAMALGLAAQGYWQPDPTVEIPVAGDGAMAAIRAQLYNMKEGGHISDYDAWLGAELARVLCGGGVPAGTRVSEQYLLDLEREVFLRVCGQRKTLDRMQAMLKTGKPLRN